MELSVLVTEVLCFKLLTLFNRDWQWSCYILHMSVSPTQSLILETNGILALPICLMSFQNEYESFCI